MSSYRRLFLVCVILLGLSALAGCDFAGGDTAKGPPAKEEESPWREQIAAHTSGLVSRSASIRVRFVNDVVEPAQVGQSAEQVFQLEPDPGGQAVFADTRQIVLVPDKPLRSGQEYRARVRSKGLKGLPAEPDAYEFQFTVLKQAFEVELQGLTAVPNDDRRMILRGSLTTADVDDGARIEQVLTASYLGEALPVEWEHNVDGRHHDFSIGNITRRAHKNLVRLAWDGAPVGVADKGSRDIEVPAYGVFKLLQARAVQDGRQYVELQFSDRLDPSQDLSGLVSLGDTKFTTRIEGNLIKLYPGQTLKGQVSVTVEAGLRNATRTRLDGRVEQTVAFASQLPQVRFAGKGVILPDNDHLTIPFESLNVRSVQVTAFRVFDNNIGQFLQTNKLGGDTELPRVGRHLWRKTIALSAPVADKWNRYLLDATELLKAHPGGLFRLTLSINRGDSLHACSTEDNDVTIKREPPPQNHEDLQQEEASSWDYAEDYYAEQTDSSNWGDRKNPCKDAYYRHADGVRDQRNFLASNIGVIAKRDARGKVHVVTTDLGTAAPMKDVQIELRNFQDQPVGRVRTNKAGFAELEPSGVPFYLVASTGSQKGFLKMSAGAALATSHFDVGGQQVKGGIKGHIYGERGVWRPGDQIFLTFALQDKDDAIPDNHPVTMQLYSPKGQLMQSVTNNSPAGHFYTFTLKTAEDALTGNWKAVALLGGHSFSKKLKIETVVPNRLKVEVDFGKKALYQAEMPAQGTLFAQWLSGAKAGGLKADVKAVMRPVKTRFERFPDFVFDDPAREFKGEPQALFEGEIDAEGYARFEKDLWAGDNAPGVLQATLTSRVFEEGGAFSSNRMSLPYHPYPRYVGIKLPKGDAARGMLLTDTAHTVEVASVDADGEAASIGEVQVTLYKIHWKWWWDKSGDSLAQYASATHSSKLQQGKISTVDGRGTWSFEIKYPQWGRYLVRACDLDGGHCTGKVVYIDWPGWAGRAQEESSAGASVLSFFSDKREYSVGELATIQLPEATQGRALLTVETGARVLDQRWIEVSGEKSKFELPLTEAMSPTVYVSVTLVQPHQGKKNDRPIRLYGVIPLTVKDPQTLLQPVIQAADEWKPESTGVLEVSEAHGRAMTYTLAMVDEGLLGLTGFKTPDLHAHFYRKEALGVATWDLFDDVVGAYGGELERLLALGGDAEADEPADQPKKRRFPPVVRFLGAHKLAAGESKRHEISLPQYLGAVRLMVVAGEQGAYGHAEKSVYVRDSLSLLATLPRVLGPEEELRVPVALFVMDPAIRDVGLKLEVDEHFEIVGDDHATVSFDGPGERLGFFTVRVRPSVGFGTLRVVATGGDHLAESQINIEVRNPNPKTTRQVRETLAPGETWTPHIAPHGLPGTNRVLLELSTVPPLNLNGRLSYLIRYPHGCVEQLTSAAFPQLYLSSLVQLGDERKTDIEKHVHAAIERLRRFQTPEGAFTYWAGAAGRNGWATSYVGHFLLEADRLGYHVPPQMLSDWLGHQRSAAQAWTTGDGRSVLDQAYRLYTLALARKPELGAMNRLRESQNLSPVARWQLGAAFGLAGLRDVADALVSGVGLEPDTYGTAGYTFGSTLRDQAILLDALVVLGYEKKAQRLAEEISADLASDRWLSTHASAFALMAMSQYVGGTGKDEAFVFEHALADGALTAKKSASPIYAAEIPAFPVSGDTVTIHNTSGKTLHGAILVEGVPPPGKETSAAEGLAVKLRYRDLEGGRVDVVRLAQGSDFVAEITVINRSPHNLENLALTHIVPSGWEIHNPRLDGGETEAGVLFDYQDVRDDRVLTYFGLKRGERKQVRTLLHASYLGRYYRPGVSAEAMYDAEINARTKGQWVEVIKAMQ